MKNLFKTIMALQFSVGIVLTAGDAPAVVSGDPLPTGFSVGGEYVRVNPGNSAGYCTYYFKTYIQGTVGYFGHVETLITGLLGTGEANLSGIKRNSSFNQVLLRKDNRTDTMSVSSNQAMGVNNAHGWLLNSGSSTKGRLHEFLKNAECLCSSSGGKNAGKEGRGHD